MVRFMFPYELVDVPAQLVEFEGKIIERSRGWKLRTIDEPGSTEEDDRAV